MYEAFYGLTGKPFQLSPDPKFYFDSRQHRSDPFRTRRHRKDTQISEP